MKPERNSKYLLSLARAKAKMHEYSVPSESHIELPRNPARLFTLAIGLLGEASAQLAEGLELERSRTQEAIVNLQFAARFFDSYFYTRLNESIDPYVKLLGSSAYYLCNLPGSSLVLAESHEGDIDVGGRGLESLLLWLLKGDFASRCAIQNSPYSTIVAEVSRLAVGYLLNGNDQTLLLTTVSELRKAAYASGSSRELLLADVIAAIVRSRVSNSTWRCIPEYTDLSVDSWTTTLAKKTFLKELWPAQHLLGKNDVFRGVSATIQMPTSAGKTRATEILIRSSLLSGRATVAVIVAPFRALCHEIKASLVSAFVDENVKIDELSDVFQNDCDWLEMLDRQSIIVSTPEKLLYVLRQSPEIADRIGLLIYDEGHQFDSGLRGVTFELLLTSLKSRVPENVQTALISAVINNAEVVNRWLNGVESKVVTGSGLIPTYRTVAFWNERNMRLEFVNPTNPNEQEFFVPRILETYSLFTKRKRKQQPYFPERQDGKDLALYFGLRLCRNGSVAVFCGRKDTAALLCRRIAEVYEQGLPLTSPADPGISDPNELALLCALHDANLGANSPCSKAARLGIFSHHGNTPPGIRLAVEYALQQGLIKYVICTSTLAQGVNLPIRYLLVTSIYQGKEKIKARDFHNLIGRVGRSGMHTEGSIIFSDPEAYHGELWGRVTNLLDARESDLCNTTLLSVLDKIRAPDRDEYLEDPSPLELLRFFLEQPEHFYELPDLLSKQHVQIRARYTDQDTKRRIRFRDEVNGQLQFRVDVWAAIESYLMANWDDMEESSLQDRAESLAQETLAYYLATDAAKSA